ncbi:MAG: hypothetical protein NTZ09_10500 [Candidatus Hydrogenedentes bacterium]|nr:hypothetical protein [Candidatus Hydrogenedentota bacterium]
MKSTTMRWFAFFGVFCLFILSGATAQESGTPPPGTFYWVVTRGDLAPINGPVIYGVRADNGDVAVLYAPDRIPEGRIIWSPKVRGDGKLVFHTFTSSHSGGNLFWGKIGTPHPHALASSYIDEPAGGVRWSPGGGGVLFSNKNSGIHAMDLNPSTDDETVLTTNYFDEVVAVTHAGTIFFDNSMYRLPNKAFTMNANGSNIQGWDIFGNNQTEAGDLSPDGTLILAVNRLSPGIWAAKPDKSWKLKIYTAGGVVDGYATWGPDSQIVAFINGGNVWTVQADGTQLTQLTHGEIADPRVWSFYERGTEGEGEGDGEEGEGEGEAPEPCAYRTLFDSEWPLLAAALDLPDDDVVTPGEGIPERWGLAMVRTVLCNEAHPWHMPAFDAYEYNVASIEAEPAGVAAQIAPYRHVIAALLMVNQNKQDRLKELLGLVNDYATVRSNAKGPEEIFSDSGDLDGDGATNLEEYLNIIAWGGSIDDFAYAASVATWWQGGPMPASVFYGLMALVVLLLLTALATLRHPAPR